MVKAYPEEFCRDVIAVARKSGTSVVEYGFEAIAELEQYKV